MRHTTLKWTTVSAILLLTQSSSCSAFSRPFACQSSKTTRRTAPGTLYAHTSKASESAAKQHGILEAGSKAAASVALCSLLLLTATTTTSTSRPAMAYDPSDYASETVQTAVQSLKDSKDTDSIVKAYENIAEIITEGKGVGGEINFKGVQLDRGYVADEDTSIYNPGLTLLTESEKNRLVNAIVESKKKNADDSWNVDTQAGFVFLREKLDPLHMYELSGYLKIVPFYGAALYLGVLAVQQLARDLFPVAYIAGVVAIFGPAVALILLGP